MSTPFSTARALIFAAAASLALAPLALSAESKAKETPAVEEKAPPAPKAEETSASEEKAPKAPPAPKLSLGERIQATRQALDETREATLKANPKLVERQRKLDAMVLKTIRANGVDPEKDEKRLAELKAEIKAMNKGEFDHKRRLALTDEHRAITLRLAKAREEAMQDEKVVKTREALREDVLAAMRKQNPETDQLLAELRELSAEARNRNAQRRMRR